jgi:hypothetical protein
VANMVPATASLPSPSPDTIWSALPLSVLCSDPSCSCPCTIVELMASWCGGASHRVWSSAALLATVRLECWSTVPPRQLKLFAGPSQTGTMVVRVSSPDEHVRPA